MLESFYPDQYMSSAYCIDFQSFYDAGYRESFLILIIL